MHVVTPRRWPVAFLLVGALFLSACSSASPTAAPAGTAKPAAGAPAAGKTYRIGVSASKVANPAARQLYAGFVYRARQLGMEAKVNDSNLDINKQVSDIDQFTSQKMDAILLQLVGDPNAVKGPLDRARQAGIHIFAFDQVPGVEGVELVASQPSIKAGELGAEWIGKKLGNKGNVAIIGGPPVPVLAVRWEAAKKTFADKYSGIKVLEQQDAIPDDATGGRKIAENLLAKYPNLDALWTPNDSIAAGAGAAVRAAGRQVVITGINADEEGIQGIKEGTIGATWDTGGLELGQKAADAALKILSGETPKSALPVNLTVDPIEYSKDNVDKWVAPEKRIEYPPLS